jgi:hypothetical protein
MYPVLTYILPHEDVCGSGGTVPLILNTDPLAQTSSLKTCFGEMNQTESRIRMYHPETVLCLCTVTTCSPGFVFKLHAQLLQTSVLSTPL